MSGAEIILLCEDTQTDSFVRNFLKHRNFGRYDIDTCPLSNGSGAGKQWVLERYPEQLQLIRKKKNAYLIVIIDADKDTIDDCHKRLEAACRDKSIPPRDKKDSNVLHIIPRRNIETWLAYLDNRNVDEFEDYRKLKSKNRKLKYKSNCKEYAKHLHDMCRAQKLREPAPPSLQGACIEYRKLKRKGTSKNRPPA